MLRRLILMRHAKSSWKSGAPTDRARPLNKRGRRDAPRVARRLHELDWLPEVVLSSDAARTRETWALMAEVLPREVRVEFLATLYHGDGDALGKTLDTIPADVRTVLALGHNPAWEEIVTLLCGAPVTMKTACAALLELELVAWRGGVDARGRWRLVELIEPRRLAEEVETEE